MQRQHLFEFNDQPWLPGPLRVGITDYLERIARLAKLQQRMAPHIDRVLLASGSERMVDLCGGSGGSHDAVREVLSQPVPVVVTDLFPAGITAAGERPWMTVHPEPVDARRCDLPGMRTMFNALHHFQPDDARRILASAAERGEPIAVFEVTHRDPGAFLALLILPTIVVLVTPFLRPKLMTLVLTYLVPVLPAIIGWDGFVSHLRTYSVDELTQMTNGLGGPDYHWEIGREAVGPGTGITRVLGWSRAAAEHVE